MKIGRLDIPLTVPVLVAARTAFGYSGWLVPTLAWVLFVMYFRRSDSALARISH